MRPALIGMFPGIDLNFSTLAFTVDELAMVMEFESYFNVNIIIAILLLYHYPIDAACICWSMLNIS